MPVQPAAELFAKSVTPPHRVSPTAGSGMVTCWYWRMPFWGGGLTCDKMGRSNTGNISDDTGLSSPIVIAGWICAVESLLAADRLFGDFVHRIWNFPIFRLAIFVGAVLLTTQFYDSFFFVLALPVQIAYVFARQFWQMNLTIRTSNLWKTKISWIFIYLNTLFKYKFDRNKNTLNYKLE